MASGPGVQTSAILPLTAATRRATRTHAAPPRPCYVVDAALVAAWCELRADLRHFRVERIAATEVLAERYPDDRGRLLAAWLALGKDRPAAGT